MVSYEIVGYSKSLDECANIIVKSKSKKYNAQMRDDLGVVIQNSNSSDLTRISFDVKDNGSKDVGNLIIDANIIVAGEKVRIKPTFAEYINKNSKPSVYLMHDNGIVKHGIFGIQTTVARFWLLEF